MEKKVRNESVDFFRVIAILCVIAIHSTPFEVKVNSIGDQYDLATVINQIARFAVPFFFVIAGYYWAMKFDDDQDVLAPSVGAIYRVIKIFLVWSIIYLLPWNLYDSFSMGLIGPVKVFIGMLNDRGNAGM